MTTAIQEEGSLHWSGFKSSVMSKADSDYWMCAHNLSLGFELWLLCPNYNRSRHIIINFSIWLTLDTVGFFLLWISLHLVMMVLLDMIFTDS